MNTEKLKEIFQNRLKNNKIPFIENFVFGTYIEKPDIKGCFCEKEKWFIYEIDEKKVISISGPFYENDIIAAIATLNHCSEFFDDYRFSEEGLKNYIHNHFRSYDDAVKSF